MAIFLYGYFSVRGYITLRCMIILLQGFEVQLVERRRDREEREEAVRRSSIESVGQSQICNLQYRDAPTRCVSDCTAPPSPFSSPH